MRSTEFITEGKTWYEEQAVLIEKNCLPFLRQIKNLKKDILYRGVYGDDSNKLISIGTCPVNRKPLDTPIDLHLASDEWFLKNTGIRYRSNAVFCTGDQFVAQGYGELYAIFPIGEFSFCYSPSIGDLSGPIRDMDYSDAVNTPEGQEELNRLLKSGRYKQNTDLRKAIASGSEIMLHCKQYYAILIEASDDAMAVYLKITAHINRGMLG